MRGAHCTTPLHRRRVAYYLENVVRIIAAIIDYFYFSSQLVVHYFGQLVDEQRKVHSIYSKVLFDSKNCQCKPISVYQAAGNIAMACRSWTKAWIKRNT